MDFKCNFIPFENERDVTVYLMLGRTEHEQRCQFAGKYVRNYKKVWLKMLAQI